MKEIIVKPFTSVFSRMTVIDWILAIVFTALVSYMGNLISPSYGWGIGLIVSLLLLYLAKTRRDRLTEENDSKKQ